MPSRHTSVESVTLTGLSDDVHGNLNGQGTCVTGGAIAVSVSINAGTPCRCQAMPVTAMPVTRRRARRPRRCRTTTATAPTSASGGVTVQVVGEDWGDAPDPSYPTLDASGG